MDFLSWFQSSPEKQIERLRKKVKEPHGDSSVRQNAARKLAEMDDQRALRALLDRYTITVSPSVEDEQEKEEVFRWIVARGERSVDPLIDFLRTERMVYWPARALKAILPEERLASEFSSLLRYLWENPPASAFPKAQIIRALGDVSSPELNETVRLFLEDEDDDVCLASVEYLLEQPEEEAREPILNLYAESEGRPRVRSQILEYFAEKGWTVKGFRPLVEETLPEGYQLTREGKLRRVGT